MSFFDLWLKFVFAVRDGEKFVSKIREATQPPLQGSVGERNICIMMYFCRGGWVTACMGTTMDFYQS